MCLEGRIDGMAAVEIEAILNDMILEGERVFGADFEKVHYISSAGLRVFMGARKKLDRVGGEIILTAVPPMVLDVFSMTGFDKLFRIVKTRKEAGSVIDTAGRDSEIVSTQFGEIHVEYATRDASEGVLSVFGDQRKLNDASYGEEDVVRISSRDVVFGAGLGTLGDQYAMYKDFFGEAMIINRSFFFYPAVKNPAVDFMLSTEEHSGIEYNFLHGFGFKGAFRYVLSFEGRGGPTELARIVEVLFQVSRADLIGVVILGESKGVWGMHLKRVPIAENRPKNGKTLFDRENFPKWMNFPVEPIDINHVVACTGVAVRNRKRASPRVQEIMAEESNFHIHGGIFSKTPLSKKIDQFEGELRRILMESDVYKLQHLLGKTRFGSGMAAIVELKG